MLDVDFEEEFVEPENNDVVDQFVYLYYESSILINDFSKERIKRILVNLILLGNLIGFSDEDIIDGSLKKIERNKKRFDTGF